MNPQQFPAQVLEVSGQCKGIAVACMLTFSAVSQAAGTWETTLAGRDIDGRPVPVNSVLAEFAYDAALDVTWYLKGSDSRMFWSDARDWATGLTVGVFGGWRLPAADPACGSSYNCTTSEMGQLWYVELGNPAHGPMSSTGPFKNLKSFVYWSGTDAPSMPVGRWAWAFVTEYGYQREDGKLNDFYALAVRAGDVAAVPEPEIGAMLLAGLGLLGFAARRKERKPDAA